MSVKKILLLDIENIHQTETQLLKLLKTYHAVYLVYAKSPVALSLDALTLLSPFVTQKKLVIIKMPKIGKDAADIGLAFLAGQLSIQMNKNETVFDVMSNDGILDYVVSLLDVMGFKASQIKHPVVQKSDKNPSVKITLPEPEEFDQKPHLQKIKHYCDYLKKCSNNKPSKISALLNSVQSVLKSEKITQSDDFINLLKKWNILKQNGESIVYSQEIIDAWAALPLIKLSNELNAVKTSQKIEIQINPASITEKNKDDCQTSRQISDIELERIRNRLANRLNVARHLRPKYLAGFKVLLKQQFPDYSIEDVLDHFTKNQWIQIEERLVHYSPKLLTP